MHGAHGNVDKNALYVDWCSADNDIKGGKSRFRLLPTHGRIQTAIQVLQRTWHARRSPMQKKVLLVDDSHSMREAVSFVLCNAGYEVLTASSATMGLAKASASPVDLVLTDLQMPGMDGFEFVSALRANPVCRSVPICMFTTDADTVLREQGRNAGLAAWVVKPINGPKLLDVVKTLIG